MALTNLYERIMSQKGSLENLMARVPGFRGYQEKQARRKADTLLRQHLSSEFQKLVNRFGRIEHEILDGGKGLKYMSRTREVKSKMQSYTDRVSTAAPKYSGMWASIKIDDEALDRVYAFDEAQIRFQIALEKALDELEAKVKAGEAFDSELDAVYDTAVEAIEAFNMREDIILELSKDL
ncbi:hypothetical protein G4Y79_14750 [Phototrophicus methaneseepsis]|uniref:Uncharacterized protein n=1 Tax=Phototrophicus methaneseepsis TaxID=2710758 RepID=A0A7S8E5W2_9CHLR|nr:hypothetical protein [Phototrophicus methaneseepsis]QPC80964.1 hypothetical protein G4Y79_14750 [Phototrophicus methaneseepsis]